jgi:hypothetical protein
VPLTGGHSSPVWVGRGTTFSLRSKLRDATVSRQTNKLRVGDFFDLVSVLGSLGLGFLYVPVQRRATRKLLQVFEKIGILLIL